MAEGWVYILINPALQKDLLKIGKTIISPEDRAKQLSTTGVPTEFHVAYDIKVKDCDKAELNIHNRLSKYRYQKKREFFKIPLKTAILILNEIAEETGIIADDQIKIETDNDKNKENDISSNGKITAKMNISSTTKSSYDTTQRNVVFSNRNSIIVQSAYLLRSGLTSSQIAEKLNIPEVKILRYIRFLKNNNHPSVIEFFSNFTNEEASKVSNFLQKHMKDNNINSMTADECADLLAENKILSNNVGPKSGFNFRKMLRDGRDGKIILVLGASQERPNTEWTIYKVEN